MFEDKTSESLLSSILARILAGVSKQEGTFSYDVSSAFSVELAIAYTQLERVLRLGFADTSSGTYLDQRADEHGVTRKAAIKATGEVTVTGSNGAIIPQGSVFATGNGTRFVTTVAAMIIGTSCNVAIEAETAGAAGDVAAGTITVIPVSISGVSSVANADATTSGSDVESDTDLLTRLLQRVRNQGTSGNSAHYKQWATETNGVGDAKVYPLWNGAGTVKVVLLDPNKRAPVAQVVTDTANYIETQRPIGATVTVEAATEGAITANATLTLASGKTLTDAINEFTPLFASYLESLAFVDSIVRISKVGNLLFDCPSVMDYNGLTLNGGTGNIAIADGHVAVPGAVTFS